MYVKIVRHIIGHGVSDSKGRVWEKVVPAESMLYEVSKVIYHKMANETPDDIEHDISAILESFNGPATVIRASNPIKTDSGCSESECIVIEMELADGTRENVIAIDSQMFVMNENGKTIEAVSCASC